MKIDFRSISANTTMKTNAQTSLKSNLYTVLPFIATLYTFLLLRKIISTHKNEKKKCKYELMIPL